MTELRIGVIGAGSWAAASRRAGACRYETVCCDVLEAALERGRREVVTGRFGLEPAVARGLLTRAQMDAALARLTWSTSTEMAAAADLIVECVPERST